MNEKIKQLAEQAGIIPGIMGLNRFTYFDPEKFAELIIRESIEVMVKNDYHGEWLGKKVKEHFGVKDE